ncbi:MAG: hypothetical protein COB14_06340 [Alphaproteobacteria bacterium]|nr:MAG: hypothetical protein COB14_06340 [Alphaproteobacteria bacterium]
MPRFFILLSALYLFFTIPAQAQDQDIVQLDTSYIARLPILHEGRIKPLDSFARIQLRTFSGKESGALAWLIETLFDPVRAETRPVLKIINPEILTILHLERRKNKLYSYKEISEVLRTKQKMILSIVGADEADWSVQQRELITLQKNAISLQNLLGSLTLILPLSTTLPDSLPAPFKPYTRRTLSFIETLELQDILQATLKDIIAEKDHNIETYTPAEQALAHLSFTLSLLQETRRNSDVFKVIPTDNGGWLSPWESLSASENTQLKYWQDLSAAYYGSDMKTWDDTARNLYIHVTSNTAQIRPKALNAEYYYNLYPPFFISFIACLIGMTALITSLFRSNALQMAAASTALLGSFICQLCGIALRIFILDRPPVSTLYETILFASLITTLYALIAYRRDKKILWLWLGLSLAIFLHILGFSHNLNGDSFVMLIAVLNTNFWLTTHVLCITAGYAFCALTSILAHYTLIKSRWNGGGIPDNTLFKSTLTAALLALFFATIGTVLGGIWADQSWGRFWGWDPKENGALLIVLWLIWIIHGRISGQMKQHAVLCGFSYLSVILALSWFGVNLLGVGLHAYGFMDSALWSLGLFIGIESVFVIAVTLPFLKRITPHA